MTGASDPPLPPLARLMSDRALTALTDDVFALMAAVDADPLGAPAPVPAETAADRRVFDALMGGPAWRGA